MAKINFMTERETVKGKVSIWAVPRTEWQIEQSQDKRLFEYRILGEHSSDYTSGAVKVLVAPINILVPEGINLLEKALETLDEAARAAYSEYQKTLDEIERQKDRLKLLAFDPDHTTDATTEAEVLL